jgi:hypothetical protein
MERRLFVLVTLPHVLILLRLEVLQYLQMVLVFTEKVMPLAGMRVGCPTNLPLGHLILLLEGKGK